MDQGQKSTGTNQGATPSDATAHILKQRGSQYGDFTTHAEITQALKRDMGRTGGWHRLSDNQKEALEMIVHKIGRILNGDPNLEDSWADIAGYARLAADRVIKPEPTAVGQGLLNPNFVGADGGRSS